MVAKEWPGRVEWSFRFWFSKLRWKIMCWEVVMCLHY